MIIQHKTIARKYARAFLNLYFDAVTEQHVQALTRFRQFLCDNRGVLCYLNLPGLSLHARSEMLNKINTLFGLPLHFTRLIEVLRERRCVELLPFVITAILDEFWARKHILLFAVTSSHELAAELQNEVIAFLAKITGAASIRATFEVDEELICGISMRSDCYLFEHSVARELKKFKESLLERVQL